MSGWTCITIDSEKDEENISVSDPGIRDRIKSIGHELVEGVDSKEELEDLASRLNKVEAEVGVKDVQSEIERYWEDKLENASGGLTYEPDTARHGRRGLANDKSDARKKAREIMSECKYADRVLIVSANDTSDSGSGILFERGEDGDAKFVDEETGYEGALARDVTGYFRKEHNISGLASPH